MENMEKKEGLHFECEKMREEMEKKVEEFRRKHLDRLETMMKEAHLQHKFSEEKARHERQLIEKYCVFYRLQCLNSKRKSAKKDVQRAAARALLAEYGVKIGGRIWKKDYDERSMDPTVKTVDTTATAVDHQQLEAPATNRGPERALKLVAPASSSDRDIGQRYSQGGLDFLQWMLKDGMLMISDDEKRSLYSAYEEERLSRGELVIPGMRKASEVLAEVRKNRAGGRRNPGYAGNRYRYQRHCQYNMGGIDFKQWMLRDGIKELRDDLEMEDLYRAYEIERFSCGDGGDGGMRAARELLDEKRRERAYKEECRQVTDVLRKKSWEKASQIPAHMAIAAIEELKNLSVEEMVNKLREYKSHLCNNEDHLEPHALVFANGDEQYLITNIAVDLSKHFENIRKEMRNKNREDVLKMLENRTGKLREALRQNGADGVEYERMAIELRPILVTSDYTRRSRVTVGNWDDVYYGFMEVDPASDYGMPPRVASPDPIKEGLFAPTPKEDEGDRHCYYETETRCKLSNEQKELLGAIYERGLCGDYAKLFKVCRAVTTLDEAMELMIP